VTSPPRAKDCSGHIARQSADAHSRCAKAQTIRVGLDFHPIGQAIRTAFAGGIPMARVSLPGLHGGNPRLRFDAFAMHHVTDPLDDPDL
jgi:hypothetical protein